MSFPARRVAGGEAATGGPGATEPGATEPGSGKALAAEGAPPSPGQVARCGARASVQHAHRNVGGNATLQKFKCSHLSVFPAVGLKSLFEGSHLRRKWDLDMTVHAGTWSIEQAQAAYLPEDLRASRGESLQEERAKHKLF